MRSSINEVIKLQRQLSNLQSLEFEYPEIFERFRLYEVAINISKLNEKALDHLEIEFGILEDELVRLRNELFDKM